MPDSVMEVGVMPQEVIYASYPDSPWRSRVGWSRDNGDVQIAVETRDERTLIGTLLDDNDRARFGQAVRTALPLLKDADDQELGDALVMALSDAAPYVAVWATVDRTGANRLIRVVRHARDATFGKDE